MLEVAPLSARSVALSVLIGSPYGSLSVRDVLSTGEMCGIAPQTMRVALSRLVAADEVTTSDRIYTLAPHHLERARSQEVALEPRRRRWTGQWRTVVIIETGRGAAERADLRARLGEARLGELREGVWMRPDNLDQPTFDDPHTTTMLARPDDPERIVRDLWNLDVWARRGAELVRASDGARLDGRRFAAVAALVRHLRTDPALPHELTPPRWPADAMRQAYDAYRAQLADHLDREGVLA